MLHIFKLEIRVLPLPYNYQRTIDKCVKCACALLSSSYEIYLHKHVRKFFLFSFIQFNKIPSRSLVDSARVIEYGYESVNFAAVNWIRGTFNRIANRSPSLKRRTYSIHCDPLIAGTLDALDCRRYVVRNISMFEGRSAADRLLARVK